MAGEAARPLSQPETYFRFENTCGLRDVNLSAVPLTAQRSESQDSSRKTPTAAGHPPTDVGDTPETGQVDLTFGTSPAVTVISRTSGANTRPASIISRQLGAAPPPPDTLTKLHEVHARGSRLFSPVLPQA